MYEFDFGFFMKNIIIIFTLLYLLSCVGRDLHLNKQEKMPEKVDTTNYNLVILNVTSIRYLKTSEVCENIKTHFENMTTIPSVYLCNPKKLDENFLKKFENIITVDVNFDKHYYTTVLFDAIALTYAGVGLWLFPPSMLAALMIPTPNWGYYTLDTNIHIKNSKLEHKFNYHLESDFSYVYYSYFRVEEQIRALEKMINKFTSMLYENPDLKVAFDGNATTSVTFEDKFIIEEGGGRVVQRDTIDTTFAFDFSYVRGFTTVTAFYKEDGVMQPGAEGKGDIYEYRIQTSSFDSKSNFYLSPNFGAFYKNITLKDFGYDVSDINSSNEGFIPGKTTDKDGNEIDISSNSFNAEFYSLFIGGAIGFNLVLGDETIQYLLKPTFKFNLFEVRYADFDNGTNQYSGFSYPFLSSYEIEFETGLFFPQIRTGIKIGFNWSFFREFELPRKMEFREVRYDDTFKLYRPHRIYVEKAEIMSYLFFVDLIYVF